MSKGIYVGIVIVVDDRVVAGRLIHSPAVHAVRPVADSMIVRIYK